MDTLRILFLTNIQEDHAVFTPQAVWPLQVPSLPLGNAHWLSAGKAALTLERNPVLLDLNLRK